MVSGPSGGSWYPLGAKIMQVFQDNIKGISTSNQPGGGISNILAVNGGDAQIGWSYGHTTFNGYKGQGKFKKPNPNVMYFATLYPAMFQVAVRKDSPIKSFEDMKNANISPGKAKWTGTAFAESILKAFGMSFDSIKKNGGTVYHVDYTESVALMKDKHIDVYMASTSMPQASFIELEQSPGIRFIGLSKEKLDEIIKANPGYIPGVMPKGVYKSVDHDILTLGIVTDMVVSKDLADRPRLQDVQGVLGPPRRLRAGQEDLEQGHAEARPQRRGHSDPSRRQEVLRRARREELIARR